jgi:hypothetical protein
MKRTVFIAGCAIAFSGMAGAVEQAPTEPFVMGFDEFAEVSALAGWSMQPLRSLTSELALGTESAPLVVADRGRGSGGDDDDSHDDDDNSGHGSDHDDDDDDHDDDDSDDDDDDDDDSSGRDKPRVPGGSGCDDAGDIAEHRDCQG